MLLPQARALLAILETLDGRHRAASPEQAEMQARVWHQVLADVPVEYATAYVQNRAPDSPPLQPAMIAHAHRADTRADTREHAYSLPPGERDRLCPWVRLCSCTHDGCRDGWLDQDDTPVVTLRGLDGHGPTRCPVCADARQAFIAETGARQRHRAPAHHDQQRPANPPPDEWREVRDRLRATVTATLTRVRPTAPSQPALPAPTPQHATAPPPAQPDEQELAADDDPWAT